MDIDILTKIGLSKGESSVYLEILNLGLTSAGPIIKRTKLQSSTVYHILDALIEKGIISFEIKNKIKYFYAVSPKRLLDFIEQKKNKIEEEKRQLLNIIPQLSNIKKFAKKPEQEVLIFEGWNGILSAFKEAYTQIKPGMTLYAYTITKKFGGADPKQVMWLINKILALREQLNKKTKNKIRMKIIAEKDSEIGKSQAKTKYTSVKFIDKTYINPAVINIYGNISIIALWLKKPIAFYIISKEAADSFKNNFELLWETAK